MVVMKHKRHLLKTIVVSAIFGLTVFGGGTLFSTKASAVATDPAIYSEPGNTNNHTDRKLEGFIQLVGTNSQGTASSNQSDSVKTDTMVNNDDTSLAVKITVKNTTSESVPFGFDVQFPTYWNGDTTLSNSTTESDLNEGPTGNFKWEFANAGGTSFSSFSDFKAQYGLAAAKVGQVTGTLAAGQTYTATLPLTPGTKELYAIYGVQKISIMKVTGEGPDDGYNDGASDIINFRYGNNLTPNGMPTGEQFMGTTVVQSNKEYKLLPADIQSQMPLLQPSDLTFYNFYNRNTPQDYLFTGGYIDLSHAALDRIKDKMENLGYSTLIDKNSDGTYSVGYSHYSYTNGSGGPAIDGATDGMSSTLPDGSSATIYQGAYITLNKVVDAHDSTIDVNSDWKPSDNFDSYLPNEVAVQEQNDADNRVTTLDDNIKVTVSDPNNVLNADQTKAVKGGSFKVTYTYDINSSYPVSKTVTVTVNDPNSGGNSGGNTGGNNGSTTTPTNPGNSTSTTTTTTTTTTGEAGTVPVGEAVYAVKPIYLYKNATFNKSQRRAFYVQKPRINRPMFVVTAHASSKNGVLRYKVKDVNHNSKTAGLTGYITANSKYVLPVYYQNKYSQITVINPSGIKGYKNVDLTGKATAYKQGTVLKVVAIKHHNLTTRFVLSNGQYITANRKLVIAGQLKMVKSIKTKTVVNRYKTVNLTGKNATLKKGKTYRVTGYAYSHPTSTHQFGTLRYRVAGGYVTANSKYVKAEK